MRIFLTGGTGYIGGALARRLRERGDDVRALVRRDAPALSAIGCELVQGDLADKAAIASGLSGCDAVLHVAASYEVGVPASRHADIYDTNVRGTERVMRAALSAGVSRVVYISTCAAFGNTRGEIVEEGTPHAGPYNSYYEETKTLAHELVVRMMSSEGLPAIIVQPGGVYGPKDPSEVGKLVRRFLDGKLPAMALGEAGLTFAHRDDIVEGILLALDKGRLGETYVLGGQIATMQELIDTVARVAGRKPPRFRVPTLMMKMMVPFGRIVGRSMGVGPNLRELISSGDGVTYWATHEKASRELGYNARSLEEGVREMLVSEGRIG
jgi:dihydroflavonol-4-reductase